MAATLPKTERLSSKTAIGRLMDGGRWSQTPHLRCCCLSGNGLEYNRIMVSVPKRNFRRAVRRNLLKRRLRESYRLQKDLLGPGHDLLFVYTATDIADSAVIRAEVAALLEKIAGK